jgi:hypothetical protein
MGDFEKQFRKFGKKLRKSVPGSEELRLDELLTEGFLARKTQFSSIQDIFDKAGVDTAEMSGEDVAKMDSSVIDDTVAKYSEFNGWHEMVTAAYAEVIRRRMR